MSPFNLVLILFIINLLGCISFYLVDFGYDQHLDLPTPIALIIVTGILGLGVVWGTTIRQAHNITT